MSERHKYWAQHVVNMSRGSGSMDKTPYSQWIYAGSKLERRTFLKLQNKLADLHNVIGEWDWHLSNLEIWYNSSNLEISSKVILASYSNLERQLFQPGYGRDRDRIHLGAALKSVGGSICPLVPCWLRPWSWGLTLSDFKTHESWGLSLMSWSLNGRCAYVSVCNPSLFFCYSSMHISRAVLHSVQPALYCCSASSQLHVRLI